MHSLKKKLFVASLNPFLNGGGSQATRAYLDATLDLFGNENVRVMIGDEYKILEEYKDLHYITVPKRSLIEKSYEYFWGYLSRFTLPLYNYLVDHKDDYDVCIINGSLTCGRKTKSINELGIKTITIFHNYEIEYHKDNRTKESLYGHYLGIIKDLEKNAFINSSLNLFLTEQDKSTFRRVYGKERNKSSVLGTFDYKNREVEKLGKTIKDYDIVISGSLSDYQTVVGVVDFVNNYLKIAERIIPNLKILITGRNPRAEIINIVNSRPDIFTMIPNPEFILPIVQSAKMYLCPTCIGGGLKLRAMDGLKCGLPLLSNIISSRGYDNYFEKPYYKIYHDERSFETGLLELWSFINSNTNFNENINNDYYAYFGYQSGLSRFEKEVESIL